MKTWITRSLILLLLVVLAPLAQWLQWILSTTFGNGDGVIKSFYINYAVDALPTLVVFLIVGLCLWWFRGLLSSKPLMLTICSIVVLFGLFNFAAEILLTSRPKPIGDDNDHRVPFPYIEFKGSFESGQHNVLGYGGRIPAAEKKAGEYRVFFIGGSTVRFGFPPIPELVEEMFHADGFDEVQVFNFGVSGSNTSMELARLVFEVRQHQADMVVSYSGGNDINLPLVGDPRPGYPFNYMVRENHPLLAEEYPLAALTAYGSQLLRLLGQQYFKEKFTGLTELRQNAQWNTEAWREKLADKYADNIKASARFAEVFDSAFVAILQPSLLTRKNPAESERNYLQQYLAKTEKSLGLDSADWALHDQSIREGIRLRLSGFEARHARFVDMSTAFDEREAPTYLDLIHIDQDANSLISRRIYEVLREIRITSGD